MRDSKGRFTNGNIPWTKGRPRSRETRLKIAKANTGNNLGKPCSEETREKIGLANLGRHHTKEARLKMSNALKGEKHPGYGKPRSEETKRKISLGKLGKKRPDTSKRMKEWQSKYMRTITKIFPNKPEKKIIDIINKYNLPYKYTGDGAFWIENMNPDFVNCNGEKIALEVFGDYWHRDDNGEREIMLKKYGWDCIIIWEHEIKELPELEIVKRIRRTD